MRANDVASIDCDLQAQEAQLGSKIVPRLMEAGILVVPNNNSST